MKGNEILETPREEEGEEKKGAERRDGGSCGNKRGAETRIEGGIFSFLFDSLPCHEFVTNALSGE